MRMIPTCSIVFPCREIRQPTPVRGIRGPIVAGLTGPSSTTRICEAYDRLATHCETS